MIKKAISNEVFKGIKLEGEKNVVSHIQFADDMLVFINDDWSP